MSENLSTVQVNKNRRVVQHDSDDSETNDMNMDQDILDSNEISDEDNSMEEEDPEEDDIRSPKARRNSKA